MSAVIAARLAAAFIGLGVVGMTMKRIVLTAADYGLAFGIDRSIRDLVGENRLSAVGCLAASDLWSREYLPLRESVAAGGFRTLVGVTVALSGPFQPLSAHARRIFNGTFPSPSFYRRRGLLGLLPDEILIGEIRAQVDRFQELYDEPPVFVVMHEELDRRPGVARLLVKALSDHIADGLTVLLHNPRRWRNRLLARRIAKLGGESNPAAIAMPASTDKDVLHRFFWSGLDFYEDNTCVWCSPGSADDRLRRLIGPEEVEVRKAHFAYLQSQEFFVALSEKERFLF